ncbi:MAG: glycyl-radical enzyme activating protein [Clostridia bacterium]
MTGIVFDIQRFSVHDGPGIRTTVFMKGCSLDCAWCHNPESISPLKEVQAYLYKCIGCGKCIEACAAGAHSMNELGRVYDRSVCIGCGKCVESCYSGTLVQTGRDMTPAEVLDEIYRDMPFYKDSGGGATVSGGEPLLQADFVAEILKGCREKGIHTAVDTAGKVPFSAFEKVIPFTDMFLYDLKIMDSDFHRKFTGSGNKLILENLSRLGQSGITIRIRIPVIPGANDFDDNFIKAAGFIRDTGGIESVEPLACHSLGAGKLESLGMAAEGHVFETPSKERMKEICSILSESGVRVVNKSK